MIEYQTRLYHCHKVRKHIHILEDYEKINGVRTLVKCQCPVFMGTEGEIKCNGMNDYNFKCNYASYAIKEGESQ